MFSSHGFVSLRYFVREMVNEADIESLVSKAVGLLCLPRQL